MRNNFRLVLSLLPFVFMTACGGGRESSTLASGATSVQSSGQTTTTLFGTTTTSAGSTTTTTATVVTTTAANTTTTVAGTSTTSVPQGSLPPLAATQTLLDPASSAVLGTPFWGDGDTGSGGQGATVGNAKCVNYDSINSLAYYAHAHISIFRDGQRLAIPRYIGYAANCLYELNVDNMNGVVDMYSTEVSYKRLTLGDFFGVWGHPLSWTNVAGLSGQVVIYVEDNGILNQYMGANPGDIDLIHHRSVTIQIGSRLNEIPIYNWQQYNGGH
ncbi:MAG: hypothetical protein HYS18_13635 [Burkholderiales bacterium]|nr:hypothetical protein [Burkholderiales bacterium]